MIVTAYVLNIFDKLLSDSIVYQLLNLFGSLGIVVAALDDKAYQPAVLNIIWAIIATISIVQTILTLS